MIDIAKETLIHISAVPDRLPRRKNGRPVHEDTVRQWARRGVRGVKLGTVPIGGMIYTSLEELQRFAERRTDPQAVRTPTDARRSHERAKRFLGSQGVTGNTEITSREPLLRAGNAGNSLRGGDAI